MTEYRLISSDSHVTIPDEAWQEYLDPEFRDRAPRIESTDEGDFRVFEGNRTAIMTLNNLARKKPEDYSLNIRKLEEQRSDKGAAMALVLLDEACRSSRPGLVRFGRSPAGSLAG